MNRDEIYKFLGQSDCFVSLHRSEGFGLAIAEAMLLGKPVITTNWSGNTDFCDSENTFLVEYDLIKLVQDYGPYKKGQIWADPSVEHAAVLMGQVMRDRPLAEIRAEKASKDVQQKLSPTAIGQLMRRHLTQAYQNFV